MTADQSPDQGSQRTVAELLAQYGGGGRSGSRRRRHTDDDSAPDGAERISASELLHRDESRPGGVPDGAAGTGGAPAGRAPRGHRPTGHRPTGHVDPNQSEALFPQTAPPPPPPAPAVPEQRWASGVGYSQSIDPLTGEPIDQPRGRAGTGGRGVGPDELRTRADHPSMSAPSTAFVPPPAGPARVIPATRTDPPTEQLPRYPRADGDRGPLTGPMTGPMTGPVSWKAGGTATEPDDGPLTGEVAKADLVGESAEPDESSLVGAAPAGLAERDEDLEEDDGVATPLGVKGWLGLIAQWVAGAIVGALLWVGFSYLWSHHEVIALIAAVLATGGLVLLVRAIRRSDDLQTTMLAVLVGLVVTISPAVLLLVNR